jgi:hypothetical protein
MRAQPTGAKEPGLVYSVKQAETLGLDPQKTFQQILSDFHPKYLRLIAYWDRIEKTKGSYNFSELDSEVAAAGSAGAKLTLVFGRKVPRWPECHLPAWYGGLSSTDQRAATLAYVQTIVERYKNNPSVEYWQFENEFFFKDFGTCPALDMQTFTDGLALIRRLDSRPVIVTSSGELDSWYRSYRLGDVVGVSLYRRFFMSLPFVKLGMSYPLHEKFYVVKGALMNILFHKPLMVTEMQLEPWLPDSPANILLAQQFRELDFNRFQEYLRYVEDTDIPRVYFWGVEWWYWLQAHGHPEFLNYVRDTVFSR